MDNLPHNPAFLLPISARNAHELKLLVKALIKYLDSSGAQVSLRDLCYTAGARYSQHDCRLAIAFHTREKLIEYLGAYLKNEARLGMSYGQKPPYQSKLAFVFPGFGPQWWGMGREFLEHEPVFRSMIEECDRILSRFASWSLMEELSKQESQSRLDDVEIGEPALFALQVGLAALWRSLGAKAEGVVGHSFGETAAVCAGGVFSLEDAIRTAYHHGRIMQRAKGLGNMAAVGLSLEEAQKAIQDYKRRISIAAVNGPNSVVLSGETAALQKILATLEEKQIFARIIKGNYAFHSPQIEPLRDELVRVLQGIEPKPSAIPIFSTVTGQLNKGKRQGDFNAEYWGSRIIEPVLFAPAMKKMVLEGYNIFLEISPHPVLCTEISACLSQARRESVVLPSLRRGEKDRFMMLGSLGSLYRMGYPVQWDKLYPAGKFIQLPSSPAQSDLQTVAIQPEPVQISIQEALVTCKAADRRRLVESYLCKLTAKVLNLSPSKLNLQEPLNQTGLDSIGAFELRNGIERDIGTNISVTSILSGLNILQLASEVTSRLESISTNARKWLRGKVLDDQLSYWKKQLQGMETLQLPTDHPRPPVQIYRGATQSLKLPKAMALKIKELSRAEGVTEFMTLFAVFNVLLSRHAGQYDIPVGTRIANRNRSDIEGSIGEGANTLVLRTDLSGDPTFIELLKRVREVSLGAYAHQDLPFEKVIEALNPEKDLSRSPLFQMMFIEENVAFAGVKPSGLSVKPENYDYQVPKFDLTLSMSNKKDGLTGAIEYNTDLFDGSTIERMKGHFQILLESIAANPERRLSELPMLTQPEKQQLLVEWNDTKKDYPKDKCVHQLFEQQVEKTPNAVAVEYEDKKLTYGELNQRANQLAHHLRAMGVGPDVLVGICVERSLEMIVGLLGILKAGGAYVPLDPAYPKERLAFMLEDSGVKALLTQKKLNGNSWKTNVTCLILDDQGGAIAREKVENPRNVTQQGNLAYVIYTSGTTGKPKGVAMVHSGLSDLIYWHKSGSKNGLATAQFSSISFDVSVEEIFTTLCGGGRLVLIPEDKRLEVSGLLEFIVTKKIEKIDLPMSVLEQLAETAVSRNLIPVSLRYFITGSEQIRIDSSVRALCERLKGCGFENQYGPTEAHVVASVYSTSGSPETWPTLPPIGRSIANTTIYLLDSSMCPVPIGVGGELCIGGAGLARGYLNRPDLTAEKFVPNPFSKEPGARLYRTGDLARYLPDGNIEYLGRIDNQVKIRGFRIELGEIESVLGQYISVAETVVIAREDVPGDKRLVAYVVGQGVSRNGAQRGGLEPEALRQYLKEKLPDYMVPSAFVLLDNLPLSPNGKIDRRALPVPNEDACRVRGYEPPLGKTESKLAEIWAEVLKVDHVGRNDNFIELGGDSLLAITLLERMRRHGLHVDVPMLLEAPTLWELAAAVSGKTKLVEAPANRIPPGCEAITPEMLPLVQLTTQEIERIVKGVPGGAANVQDIYPLAPLQEGILFHHLLGGDDPYVLLDLFGFDSRERVEAFLKALRHVIDRHDILRTAIIWEGLSDPVQVVWRKVALSVDEVVLGTGNAEELLCARVNPRRYRIDVRKAPLLRVYIAYDKEKDRWLMALLSHHLAGDHSTEEIMREEIQAHLVGQAEQLPEPYPFRNFVVQARLGVSREAHEDFFRRMLGDVDEPTAPFGLLDVHGDVMEIEKAQLMLDGTLARRLREQAHGLKVSTASLFHLAWARMLAGATGREDVVFGTVLFGRMQAGKGAERGMGLFMNTLPLRIRVGEDGAKESVRRTHVRLAELLQHEHASLALAQRCSKVAAEMPLFSAPLNYRYSSSLTPISSSASVDPGHVGIELLRCEEYTSYPMAMDVDDMGVGFGITAYMRKSIGPKRVCEYMKTVLEALVEALEKEPNMPVRGLEMLPEKERGQLVYEWNDTMVDYPKDKCVHQLFEEQVKRTPDAVAVEYEDQRLSYLELNRKANQLAHHLMSMGIGPDALVGICVERSLEMVVGLLGILKAGGAYVPLDPTYPKERLEFMLRDSGAKVLITQKKLVGNLGKSDVALLVLDEASGIIGKMSEEIPRSAVGRGNLVYVVYTSGSTGTPKGVMSRHGSVANFVAYACLEYKLKADDRVLQFSSVNFDASVEEIFPCLVSGATLVLRSDGFLDSISSFVKNCSKNSITVLSLPTAFWHELIKELSGKDLKLSPSVRLLIIGGEGAMPERLALWHKTQPQEIRLVNTYGPTEATVEATLGDLVQDKVTIGRPIANTSIYLTDTRMQLVPIGVGGELCIGGEGLARGYLNRPDLTAEKFIPNPFSEEPGARLYRTGDLARYLPDGNIEYLGRIDNQVKIRGFRVELGEIESVLSRHPGVEEAVVLAREDVPGDKRLVAYVVGRGGNGHGARRGGLETGVLQEYLKEKLPDYMAPSVFVFLEKLPLTPNGKIDRRALPAPDRNRELEGYVAPRNEAEKLLAKIWGKVLNLERVGVYDNYFDLGGHSLLGVRLISEIERAFGTKLPVAALFKDPTVEKIAIRLRKGEKENRFPSLVAINPKGSKPTFFCVHPIGGNVICYRDLAQHLGPDQPFYGFQSRGVEGDQEPLTKIESMAAYYIESMRLVQSKGPYYLGGWSFGGVVAFEMARQLQKQNDEVALLALFDPSVPNQINYNLTNEGALLEQICFDLVRVSTLSDSLIGELKSAAEGGVEKLQSFLKRILPSDIPRTIIDALVKVYKCNYHALIGYKPKPYSGDVILFQAGNKIHDEELYPHQGWGEWIRGKMEIYELPGDHYTMIRDPNLQLLGDKLRPYLISKKNTATLV